MAGLAETIGKKIRELENQEKNEIASHEVRLRLIQGQINVLREILREGRVLFAMESDGGVEIGRTGPTPSTESPLSAMAAVRELLESHPDGLPQKEIVIRLADQICSGSSDKKRLLYNTIFNLRKRGEVCLIQGENGDKRVAITRFTGTKP